MRHTGREARWARVLSSPQTTILSGFAGVILAGAFILWLPLCQVCGPVNFIDALFTATSAVCVTGLTVVDTAKYYSFLGQTVILSLIQIGGLGVMTCAALAFQIIGWRMSLQSQALLADSIFQRDAAWQFEQSFKGILVLTFAIEAAGALIMLYWVSNDYGIGRAVFWSLFHSISAFCNAGFSIRSENLMGFGHRPGVLFVVMSLIVLGGLGYAVLHEMWAAFHRRLRSAGSPVMLKFSLNTRVVLMVTSMLIVGGCIMLVFTGMTSEEVTWRDRLLHSLFQSITARTAGFNSVDVGRLPSASLFVLILLMFVGGSPGSCAGGVKTTALAIWLARLRASLQGSKEVRLLDRSVPEYQVTRSDLLLGLAIFWNTLGVLFLLVTQTHIAASALDLMFEQISAFGTVGLSTGLTPKLSTIGKLWIIATMYVGRLGPLTVALWMFAGPKIYVEHPKGTVMIG